MKKKQTSTEPRSKKDHTIVSKPSSVVKAKKQKIGQKIDKQATGGKEAMAINDFANTTKANPSQNWMAFLAKTGQTIKKHVPPRSVPLTNNKAISSQPELTEVVGLDCEMVGAGDNGREDLLARVSVVNMHGQTLYDTFVKPINDIEITDYRTRYSGVRPENLKNAENYEVAQKKVADLIKDKIIVGHDLRNDFRVLYLKHSRNRIRDTAKYKPFRQYSKRPSLKLLAEKILDWRIQDGEHDSVTDAKAAMALYMMNRSEWEKLIKNKFKNLPDGQQKKSVSHIEDIHVTEVSSTEDKKLKSFKGKQRHSFGKKRPNFI